MFNVFIRETDPIRTPVYLSLCICLSCGVVSYCHLISHSLLLRRRLTSPSDFPLFPLLFPPFPSSSFFFLILLLHLSESRKAEAMSIAMFPCVIKILPQYIFNKKDPFVFGVEVLEGKYCTYPYMLSCVVRVRVWSSELYLDKF
jgi:hypothetical protein